MPPKPRSMPSACICIVDFIACYRSSVGLRDTFATFVAILLDPSQRTKDVILQSVLLNSSIDVLLAAFLDDRRSLLRQALCQSTARSPISLRRQRHGIWIRSWNMNSSHIAKTFQFISSVLNASAFLDSLSYLLSGATRHVFRLVRLSRYSLCEILSQQASLLSGQNRESTMLPCYYPALLRTVRSLPRPLMRCICLWGLSFASLESLPLHSIHSRDDLAESGVAFQLPVAAMTLPGMIFALPSLSP